MHLARLNTICMHEYRMSIEGYFQRCTRSCSALFSCQKHSRAIMQVEGRKQPKRNRNYALHEITINYLNHPQSTFIFILKLSLRLFFSTGMCTWSYLVAGMMCFSCSPVMINATSPPARHARPTNRCTYFEVRLAEFATGQSVHVFY